MLMKCVCGLVPLTSGEIAVNDKIIGKDTDIPTNVGVIIETPGFLPWYSAYSNLKFLAALNGKSERKKFAQQKKRWFKPKG